MKLKTILALFLILTFFTACAEKTPPVDNTAPYSYDLSQYFTLCEYKGIEISKKEPIVVTQEEIEGEINYILYSLSTTEQIYEGTVDWGHTVNIDYIGRINGVAFNGGTGTDLNLEIGGGNFIPGFESGLVGFDIGETVFINVTFPEDYWNDEFANQEAVFEVKLNYLLSVVQPEFTDEFIRAQYPGYTTAAQYKKYIEDQIREYKEQEQINELREQIWNYIFYNSTLIKYPEVEVERYNSIYVNLYTEEAAGEGRTLEDHMNIEYGVSLEEFSTDIRNYAKDLVHEDLLFYSIAKNENITISEAEYNETVDKYFNLYLGYFETKEDLINHFSKPAIEKALLQDKVFDFILAYAVEVDVVG